MGPSSLITSALLAAFPWPAGPGLVHPNSLSASRVDVRGARVVLAIEVQVLSLAEVLPGFDEDADGRVEPSAIARDAERIAAYVAAHYRISTTATAAPAWMSLRPHGAPRVRAASLREGLFGELEQYVLIDLVYQATEPPHALALDVDLFVDTSPEHRDLAVVVWNGVELEAFDLAGRDRREVTATAAVLARGRPAFLRYVEAATSAAPREWGLLLLALVLALGAPSRAKGLAATLVIAAATAAGLVLVQRFALDARALRFVALAVPLSTAYVGLDALLARAPRTRLLEAVVFGLVAGARLGDRFAAELAREAATEFQPTSDVPAALAGLVCAALGLVCAAGWPPLALAPRVRGAAWRGSAALALVAGGLAFARTALG